jgi:hypothetical protein
VKQSESNSETKGTTKQSTRSIIEVEGVAKKWGQIGPVFQKNKKFFREAPAKRSVEEAIERLHHLEPKLKPKPN